MYFQLSLLRMKYACSLGQPSKCSSFKGTRVKHCFQCLPLVFNYYSVRLFSFQRWEKRKNAKENFPLVAHNALPEEPTKKPVLARLLEWQRKVEETGAEVPAFFQMASERQGFRAERSRKALSSALEERTGPCPALEERTAPCPAPRSGTRSGSSDRLFCDVRETQDGNGTKGLIY